MDNLIYRITNDIYLIGNDLYSYNMHVGMIEGKTLRVFSRYPRGTSKHVSYASRFLQLGIIQPEDLDRYESGKFPEVRIDRKKLESALSKKTSVHILLKLGPNPSKESLRTIIGDLKWITAMEWAWICLHLGIDTKTPRPNRQDCMYVTLTS